MASNYGGSRGVGCFNKGGKRDLSLEEKRV